MYEVKDSYFFIFDTPSLLAVGAVFVLLIAGYFFFRVKKRGKANY
ncbi:LPXTG cell wall anchor domain-containing protein [Sporosarcina sp. FSL K6-1522]